MKIKERNNILESFEGASRVDKIKIAIKKGIDNTRDLVRVSGVPFSDFVRLEHKGSNVMKLQKVEGTGIPGGDEIHFYELIGKSLALGLISGKITFNCEKDFVKSFTNNYSPESKIEAVDTGTGVNQNPDTLFLHPQIGGYLAKSQSVERLNRIKHFSVRQLDLLYKGIAELNPNYVYLDVLEEQIRIKIM